MSDIEKMILEQRPGREGINCAEGKGSEKKSAFGCEQGNSRRGRTLLDH